MAERKEAKVRKIRVGSAKKRPVRQEHSGLCSSWHRRDGIESIVIAGTRLSVKEVVKLLDGLGVGGDAARCNRASATKRAHPVQKTTATDVGNEHAGMG